MEGSTIYIKNMVCNRCIMVVEQLLTNMGFTLRHIELGKVIVEEQLLPNDYKAIDEQLCPIGFELIDDKRIRLIEQIKKEIIELIYYQDNNLKTNLSDYLTTKCHSEYSLLSKLFSETTGMTIEKYFIAQKIERVKELLLYNELSLNEIAIKLNYSSTAHLSAQFKSVTGTTPSQFKKIKEQKRKAIDQIV